MGNECLESNFLPLIDRLFVYLFVAHIFIHVKNKHTVFHQKMGQPVQDRYREAQQWPAARDEFGAALMHVRKFLDQYANGVCTFV